MNGENTEIGANDGGIEGKTLGTTKVSRGGRISLVEGVREAFADQGIDVREGDRLVFTLRDGHIVIEPDELPSNR